MFLPRSVGDYLQLYQANYYQGADIIVFPEYGLTTLAVAAMPRSLARSYLQQFPPLNNSASASECVQDYRNYPVEDDRLVFTYLSCSARRHAIYVAVDIGGYVPCSPGQNVSDSGGTKPHPIWRLSHIFCEY